MKIERRRVGRPDGGFHPVAVQIADDCRLGPALCGVSGFRPDVQPPPHVVVGRRARQRQPRPRGDGDGDRAGLGGPLRRALVQKQRRHHQQRRKQRQQVSDRQRDVGEGQEYRRSERVRGGEDQGGGQYRAPPAGESGPAPDERGYTPAHCRSPAQQQHQRPGADQSHAGVAGQAGGGRGGGGQQQSGPVPGAQEPVEQRERNHDEQHEDGFGRRKRGPEGERGRQGARAAGPHGQPLRTDAALYPRRGGEDRQPERGGVEVAGRVDDVETQEAGGGQQQWIQRRGAPVRGAVPGEQPVAGHQIAGGRDVENGIPVQPDAVVGVPQQDEQRAGRADCGQRRPRHDSPRPRRAKRRSTPHRRWRRSAHAGNVRAHGHTGQGVCGGAGCSRYGFSSGSSESVAISVIVGMRAIT